MNNKRSILFLAIILAVILAACAGAKPSDLYPGLQVVQLQDVATKSEVDNVACPAPAQQIGQSTCETWFWRPTNKFVHGALGISIPAGQIVQVTGPSFMGYRAQDPGQIFESGGYLTAGPEGAYVEYEMSDKFAYDANRVYFWQPVTIEFVTVTPAPTQIQTAEPTAPTCTVPRDCPVGTVVYNVWGQDEDGDGKVDGANGHPDLNNWGRVVVIPHGSPLTVAGPPATVSEWVDPNGVKSTLALYVTYNGQNLYVREQLVGINPP